MNKLLSNEDIDRYTASAIKTKGLTAPSAGKYIIDEIEGYESRKAEYIAQKLEKTAQTPMN
jgi:hypothetical protein